MTPSALLALADRCEAATGGSHDLNLAIQMATLWSWAHWTSSLDAILPRKPEGARWHLDEGDDGTCAAMLEDADFDIIADACASTLPLAACAAVLRAMAGEK